MSVDEIIAALRHRAEEHRANGSDADPALLERAADSLQLWKAVADTRLDQARINHEAYEALRRDTGAE